MSPGSSSHAFCHLFSHLPSSVRTSTSLQRRRSDQCCFPAPPARPLGCTPIRLNRRSLPLTSSSPHPGIPGGGPHLSLHRHFSFHPSFDISAPSVISEVPLSAEVPLWHNWGEVSPKIPAGLHVFHHKGAQYFLIVSRHEQNLHPSGKGSDLNNDFMAKTL